MTARKFKNDEEGYLAWKLENPAGFILNLPRPSKTIGEKIHRRKETRLHLANCAGMKRGRGGDGEYTERKYYKVCALNFEDVEVWCSKSVEFRDGKPMDWSYAPCKRCCPL